MLSSFFFCAFLCFFVAMRLCSLPIFHTRRRRLRLLALVRLALVVDALERLLQIARVHRVDSVAVGVTTRHSAAAFGIVGAIESTAHVALHVAGLRPLVQAALARVASGVGVFLARPRSLLLLRF